MKTRVIIRVSPNGTLTAHLAGTKPIPEFKEDWPVLAKINDRKRRSISSLVVQAYPALVKIHKL